MGQVKRLVFMLLTITIFAAGHHSAAVAQSADYRLQTDVVYGHGLINASTRPEARGLLLDAYIPINDNEGASPKPAIILAFGGAFHRGDKGNFQFSEDGASDSSMADYCTALVRSGYACFSIEYRLTPEDPVLPEGLDQSILMPQGLLESPIVTGRVEFVRQRMSLPPLDDQSREQLWAATFAAVEDMETALNFVRGNANDFNIDPDRIAVGGFSAGAMTAINLAYGKKAKVQAVIALSGTSWGYDLTKTVSEDAPPLLMLAGQWDLPGIRHGSASIANLFQSRGAPISQAWVPGFGHFYPKEAPSLSDQFDQASIIDRLTRFLNEELQERFD
ncbi:MAG: alpha/beta hydrolase fold domain-containing protein [Erythrobacter sp.]